jgi:uncharacterized protein (DUF1015 family)
MAIVKAFRAVRYNTDKVDLARVISPPYDIISSAKQQELHERSPYNFTHIDFRKGQPGEDKYKQAQVVLHDWLKNQVMVRDEKPAIYCYRQQYTIKGETKLRFGFLGLLKLEDGASGVHGHEHTHSAAKEDRCRLITAIKANLSPIFVVFEDKKRLMEQNLKPYSQSHEPFIDVADEEGIQHTLWRVDDPVLLERMTAKMKDEQIFIADGHHRYEVSCAYRSMRKAACPGSSGEDDFNFVLAYFTGIHSPGLTVLPIHRIVRNEAPPDWSRLEEGLKEYFSVEEIRDKEQFLFLIQKSGLREHAIGMYGSGRCFLLRLKNIRWPDKLMAAKSPEYRTLDTAILNTLVLEKVVGLDLHVDQDAVRYTAEAEEAMAAADADSRCIAFLMNPTRIEQIVKVASKGEKMPPKSTYFYPKVLSGLVVNKFEDSC